LSAIKNIIDFTILMPVVATFFTILFFVSGLQTSRLGASLSDRLHGFTVMRSVLTEKPSAEKLNLKQILKKLADYAPQQLSKKLDKELMRASLPISGGEFIVMQFLLILIFCLLGLLISRNLLICLGAGIFGYILPRFYLKSAQKRKKNQFNNQLTDALLIIANSLRAGFSFLQAMDLVSREMSDPISSELQTSLREMNYGTPTEEALNNLSDRVGSDDLDLVITAILIQRQVGGNLAEVLQNIHSTIQDRVRIKQEIKTLTAQGRISGFIIAALPIFIALAISVLNPAYMKLLVVEKMGWVMVGMGIISEVIGFMIVRKIINVRV
jgi:tight adherence protein B